MKRKPIPQFELDYQDEPYRLVGDVAVQEPDKCQQSTHEQTPLLYVEPNKKREQTK